jgi:hypothetical protein
MAVCTLSSDLVQLPRGLNTLLKLAVPEEAEECSRLTTRQAQLVSDLTDAARNSSIFVVPDEIKTEVLGKVLKSAVSQLEQEGWVVAAFVNGKLRNCSKIPLEYATEIMLSQQEQAGEDTIEIHIYNQPAKAVA